ncbi:MULTISPECIES: DUF4231 domain-containing protein [unclassified Mycoplasma]|uniref:DUF4231 domain-containing protein n=1 Tax=unclassified Mycoplasma TaxID=2683645 RepID=UPI00211CC637|nr:MULTISPECIES: DUF4231 domain-containing protein [unclassified Mycoplasma]UUM20049.1 DUF4231 domain-containing protein [Mycoplasma sp. 1578d]UUM25029.1 DUF4231 domain-containing protein [Mycoplasma sp. 3686d]
MNAIQIHEKIKRENYLKLLISGFFYYTLNIISIGLVFYIGIIGVIFISSVNDQYQSGTNPYKMMFPNLTKGANYILLTSIINAVISLISGLLSFFVINDYYKKQKSIREKLQLEYLLYLDKVSFYKELSGKEREYLFYKRICFLAKKDKYDRESLINKEVKHEQKRN